MLLITFQQAERTRIGVLKRIEGKVVDLSLAAPELPQDMNELIAQGPAVIERIHRAASTTEHLLELDNVRLQAPVPMPRRNIFCIGKNYRDHLDEVKSLADGGQGIPDQPIVFTKATTTVTAPDTAIPSWLDPTETTDYEGELAVVIGQGGRHISRAQAMAHVFGYTIVNDVTARALQQSHRQWFIGKSLDGYCPMGPAILTADAVPDVQALHVRTHVNGELRQDGRVEDLIFDIPALIEGLSATMTLLPGDIIATGTPSGVGMGHHPPKYLRAGDEVAVSIEPIGTLRNTVA